MRAGWHHDRRRPRPTALRSAGREPLRRSGALPPLRRWLRRERPSIRPRAEWRVEDGCPMILENRRRAHRRSARAKCRPMLFKSPVTKPRLTACAPILVIVVFIAPMARLRLTTLNQPGSNARVAPTKLTINKAATSAQTQRKGWRSVPCRRNVPRKTPITKIGIGSAWYAASVSRPSPARSPLSVVLPLMNEAKTS